MELNPATVTASNRTMSRKGQQYDSGIVYDHSPTRSLQMDPSQQHAAIASSSPYVSPLPPAVANVPKEDIRGFVHHKRVGNYLLGRTLGEGSFAKVKEAMHIQTGEKVAIYLGLAIHDILSRKAYMIALAMLCA